MGDCQNGELRVDFDRTLKLKFLGSQVTTDAGLLAYRELDEAMRLTETGAESVQDSRLGQNKHHGLLPLLRQSIYSRLAGYRYVIRLKANAVLEREIEHLLTRPVGRPSRKPKVFYHNFQYQAKSWHQPRRVVAKVEWHQGELFARVGFIVTNLTWRSKRVVRFYNGRGTAEQWIKEGKNAIQWTKLSCRTFKDNQTRLQLFALAYNLANFLRRLALPKSIRQWSLTTLREKVIKIGAKVTRHSKYVFFQLAEVAVPRQLFAAILERIGRLAMQPAVCRSG